MRSPIALTSRSNFISIPQSRTCIDPTTICKQVRLTRAYKKITDPTFCSAEIFFLKLILLFDLIASFSVGTVKISNI